MKLTIEGIITTNSPLHVTAPEKNLRYDPEAGRFLRGNRGGSPCTPTRSERLRSPLAVSESNPLGLLRLPVIPAQGLKGRLRRIAAAEIEDALRDIHDEKPPFALYQAMHSGAVTGNPDGGAPPLDVAKARRNHFFAGLFGGGTQMIPGRLKTNGGRLVSEVLTEMGGIPDWTLEHNPVPAELVWNLFAAEPVIRKDDALQFLDDRAPEIVNDYDEAMLNALGAQAERRAARVRAEAGEADEGSRERGLQAFSFVETVIPGTSFHVKIRIDGTEAQAGCLLNAVDRLLHDEDSTLGGKSAIGFGHFTADLTVAVDDEPVDDPFRRDETNTLLAAYEDELANLSVRDMQDMLTSGA